VVESAFSRAALDVGCSSLKKLINIYA
jgi:hypothetical protein